MTTDTRDVPATRRKTLRIGLLGLGTVGQGLCRLVERKGDTLPVRLSIERVLVRSPGKARAATAGRVTAARDRILRGRYDCVVEALGGTQPALGLVSAFLRRGVPVVTANKALLAEHGPDLRALAARHGTVLRAEAAVAAGVPLLSVLERSLRSATVRRVAAILNGTSNFVLTRIARGAPLGEAVREARQLGFAEADPSLDLGGVDAAQKLSILVERLTGSAPSPAAIETTSLAAVDPEECRSAAALGYRFKPLACAELRDDGVAAFVAPALVRDGHALARVDDEQNAVQLDTDCAGRISFAGPGAGGLPTAAAIVDDLCAVAAGEPAAPPRTVRLPLVPFATPWLVTVSLRADAADAVLAVARDGGVPIREWRPLGGGVIAAVTARAPSPAPLTDPLRPLRAVARVRAHRILGD